MRTLPGPLKCLLRTRNLSGSRHEISHSIRRETYCGVSWVCRKNGYKQFSSGRIWTKREDLPAPTRGSVAHSVPGVGVLVIGGYLGENGFSDQVLFFDPGKNGFVSLANLLIWIMLPAMVAAENWIFVFGDEEADELYFWSWLDDSMDETGL